MSAVRPPSQRVRCPASAPSATHRRAARMRRKRHSSRGAVTAEFAVALPAVVLLLAFLLAGAAAGATQLRLEEGARGGARELARGGSAAEAAAVVRRLAGPSAVTALASDGGWLSVTVSDQVPGAVGSLVPWTLTARAWTRSEVRGGDRAGDRRPAPGPGCRTAVVTPRRFRKPRGEAPDGPVCGHVPNREHAPRRRRRQRERGSGTILAAGLGLVVIMATALIMLLAQSAVAASRAAAAADLAALAAADSARGITAGEPCDVAGDVAARNHARVISCFVGAGETVQVGS